MANNRAWLVCLTCKAEGLEFRATAVLLAKTMGTGYYLWSAEALDAFFDAHKTCNIVDENALRIEYETGDPEVTE